jgi:hypothetical protein
MMVGVDVAAATINLVEPGRVSSARLSDASLLAKLNASVSPAVPTRQPDRELERRARALKS